MDDNTVDIKVLGGKFKKGELQEYCNKLYISLQKSEERIKQLEFENDHLKELLSSTTPLVENTFNPTSEQQICEIQIELIKKQGMEKQLSLDDTKRLETLVKILKIIKEKAPVKPATAPQSVSFDELMSMARPKD
jgi:hypothetical protein